MESQDILTRAAAIAREARTTAERADLEEIVQDFEQSPVPVLRSLAHTYRMLQFPPR